MQITQYELYNLNVKDAKQVLKYMLCKLNQICFIGNVRFSSEGIFYSPFVPYYQCEEQDKLVLVIDNNCV